MIILKKLFTAKAHPHGMDFGALAFVRLYVWLVLVKVVRSNQRRCAPAVRFAAPPLTSTSQTGTWLLRIARRGFASKLRHIGRTSHTLWAWHQTGAAYHASCSCLLCKRHQNLRHRLSPAIKPRNFTWERSRREHAPIGRGSACFLPGRFAVPIAGACWVRAPCILRNSPLASPPGRGI